MDRLVAMRGGLDAFGVVYSGRLGGDNFCINVSVWLGPEDRGRLTIAHDTFNHLSSPVPAARYSVELLAEPWQFGGRRWFMICPRSGLRVFKLYLPNGADRFAGREALGLAYRVQRLDAIGKSHARLARAFRRLGASYPGLPLSIPAKPRWMRQKTYERLVADIRFIAALHREIYVDKLQHLLAR